MATITETEAYDAMLRFLDQIYDRTQSDELGALLGSMMRLDDGGPADPALKRDWELAVRHVLESSRRKLPRTDSG